MATGVDCWHPPLAPKRKASAYGSRLKAGTTAGSKIYKRKSGRFESARRQNHDDLTAFEARVLFDLGEFGDVGLDLVQ
jgi:hypothetical protein